MKQTYILLFFAFIFGSIQLNAEGSVDFINYPGHRLFLRSDKDQQMKVYAKAGEFINVGSSHTGFDGGLISVYRPDGTLHAFFDGSDGSTGIIFNNTEELNGPTGAANNGYTPGVVQVTAATEGIWSVVYSVPNHTGAAFANLLNNAPWTRANDQPTNRRVILSWDVTVSENAAGPNGGNLLTGRVYANEYNSMINMNGVTTSPQFFVLTPDGLLYTVDFEETDPWGFPLSSSSLGLLNADKSPSYQSWPESVIERSDDPTTWQNGTIYQYEPQAEDYGGLINNKIFFNSPDTNMPTGALVTDIFRNNTHQTWLYTEPFVFEIIFNDFTLGGTDETGVGCNVAGLQYGQGAYFIFDTTVPGNVALELDVNNDGDINDPEDLIIYGYVNGGIDSVYWNGGDGLGNPIPIQDDFNFTYQFFLRGGENHIQLSDVENNTGGVVFELISDVGAIQTDLFYYDHTPVNGPVSGGGTAGSPLATNIPYTYDNQFGNKKALDYWAYVVYGDTGGGSITINIVEDCTDYTPPDSDGDGITDDIDLDDDNDGIPDYLEYCTSNDFSCLPGGFDPSGNEDNDPYLNYEDADDVNFTNPCIDLNGDGACDFAASVYDTDGDGIINSLDLDSDNDGISDLFEADHGQLDLDNNGMIDGNASLFGANGFFNVLASHPNLLTAIAVYTPSDQDNDGVLDAYDLDSDNDGIYDVAEAGNAYADADNDGQINNSPVVVDTFGLATSLNGLIENPNDKDTDGVHDFRDLDSDNDTFLDVGENHASDPDNDGQIGTSPVTVNADGVAIDTGNQPLATSVLIDEDGDGVPNFHDLDSDNDGINDVTEYWASVGNNDPNNDGIGGYGLVAVDDDGRLTVDPAGNLINSGSNPEDTDNDNLPDVWDLDSDNDSINDVEEGGNGDPDNDGIVGTGNPMVNSDGQAIEGLGGDVIANSNPMDTDGDNYPDYIDLDSDNDGINDVIENGNSDPDDDGIVGTGIPTINIYGQTTNTTSNPIDTDNDGIPDYQDLDSDNDGINDVIEGGNVDPDGDGIVGSGTPVVNANGQITNVISNPVDTDNDGIPDYLDLDSDNDGINDVIEGGNDDPDGDGMVGTGTPVVNINGQANGSTSNPTDTDNDGYPDYVDLDSDNDGINDVIEGGNDDPDGDGIVGTGAPVVNTDGQATNTTSDPTDTDNDGVPDYQDLDSDNDGINDVVESGNNDPDNDGMVGTGTPIVNTNGQPAGTSSNPTDTDNDGYPDYVDLDSDNDGINDVIEGGNQDPDGDGMVGTGTPIVNTNGQTNSTTSNPTDTDNDGYPDYVDLDSDNDGINDVIEGGNADPDGDGIIGTGTPVVNTNGQANGSNSNPTDTDNDGYPDYVDLDSDNDGINDVIEGGNADPDGDGIIGTGTPVVNVNGQANGSTSSPTDTDEDGVPDYQDLDSDNDGINDVIEGGNDDPDGDGMVGTGVPVVNTNGQTNDSSSNPTDTDNDGYPDYVDLDSDNDGINDVIEGGNDDPDGDGIIGTGTPIVNDDGQADGSTSNPTDTDNDGYPDYVDLDSDNDGINDVIEGGNDDPDGDGIIGVGTPIVNDDGQANGSTSNPTDTDNDGYPDYVDLDSDNDGINDVEEGGNVDPDNDGIVGTGTPIVNGNGQTNGSGSDPTDTDGDGMPDYIDLDSDGDNISDVVEGGNLDPDNDGIIGIGIPIVNDNGQPDGNTSNPPDTDMDGDPDYQDIDADGDGIVDIYECPDDNECVDSDGDGIPDFLDLDSDGDGINDEDECETGAPCVDTDNDGIPDFLDLDTDNDGIPDEDECEDGAPCPDTDMDGIPDWRDPECVTAIDAVVGGATYCEGEDISLEATTNVEGEDIDFVWTNTTTGDTFSGTASDDSELTLVFLDANTSHSGNYNLSITTPSDACTITSEAVFVNILMTPETPILTADNTTVCEGGTVTLNTNGGTSLTYQWFNDGIQVAETANPSLVINNLTADQAGTYTVIALNGDCPSITSNPIEITFVDMQDGITATNATSAENPACLDSDITLSVPVFAGTTVEWFNSNGDIVGNTPMITLSDITASDAGEYYAIITFETCGEITSSVTEVFVQSNNIIPELNADNDEICAGQSISLNVINDLGIEAGDNVSYTWYNTAGEQVEVTTEANYTFENVNIEGNIAVVVSINGCEGPSGDFYVTVLEVPNEFANVSQDIVYLCIDDPIEIQAVAATESEGMWRSLGTATVLNPNNNISVVSNLADGPNVFVWGLSLDLCGEFSTDTVTVYGAANLQAFDDAVIVEQNELLENADAGANDVISNSSGVTYSIVTEPQNGTASMTEAGIYSYISNEDYEGEDEFIYSLCSNECPNDCVTATVQITVIKTLFADDCFVPNGMTPNGDGANDTFEIPCLEDNYFPDNHISIFNRWGDKVYEKTGYNNDWEGTYKGKQLPAGTYFYILEIEPSSSPLQDFFTIVY